MSAAIRNRLVVLGVLWGALLAAVPALVMADRVGGFLVVALACAAASGAVGALAAGRRALAAGVRPGKRRGGVVTALGTGFYGGLVGGAVAGLLIWVLMAVTLSGFSPGGAVDPSSLMRPSVFLGSFFVALSVFLYAIVGGVLLGPAFGALVERAVRTGTKGGS